MLKDLITQKKMENASRMPDFTKIKTGINTRRPGRKKKDPAVPEVPEDVYRKCTYCGKAILNRDVRENLYRCPKCGGYFRVHARRRVELIADPGTFEELDPRMPEADPLSFPGYREKLSSMREKTGLDEAVLTGICRINGERAVLCVMDNRFIMSSMGYVVGEKITRAVEKADEERLPVIIYCASGGARMQEGIVSLMQMAKTSAALKKHRDAGLLYISVLTNPTMGGVTASFAMLGDVIVAEPEALIGFAGPRVIEQTIGEKLPEGFQHSEFLMEHGFLDIIAGREEQRQLLSRLIKAHDIKNGRKRFGSLTMISAEAPGKLPSANENGRSDKKAAEAWDKVREEAKAREFDRKYHIFASDIDPRAVEIAKQNAKRAGVDGIISFSVADAVAFERQTQRGIIVSNPPYGERMMEKLEAQDLIRRFGRAMEKLDNWDVYLISSDQELEKHYGRRSEKTRKLYNGMIKCGYYMFPDIGHAAGRRGRR